VTGTGIVIMIVAVGTRPWSQPSAEPRCWSPMKTTVTVIGTVGMDTTASTRRKESGK